MHTVKKRPQSAQPESLFTLSRKSSELRRRRAKGEDTTTDDLDRFEALDQELQRVANRAILEQGAVLLGTKQQSTCATTATEGLVSTEDDGADIVGPLVVSSPKWLTPTVASHPDSDSDPRLVRLLQNLRQRRDVRLSYPSEAPDRNEFEQRPTCVQQHHLVTAFRLRDVMAPNEQGLLDSKEHVRSIMATFEDRAVAKHNNEVELDEWSSTLPAKATAFDVVVAQRALDLEHDHLEEAQIIGTLESQQELLETAVENVNSFGQKMFDELFDLEDRRAEMIKAQARKKKLTKNVETTTVCVVSCQLQPLSQEVQSSSGFSPLSIRSPRQLSLPYGCRLMPAELFAIVSGAKDSSVGSPSSPIARRESTVGSCSPRRNTQLPQLDPVNFAASSGAPQSPSCSPSLRSSLRHSVCLGNGSPLLGDDAGTSQAAILLASSVQQQAALKQELEQCQAMCERLLRERGANDARWLEKHRVAAREIDALKETIEHTRRDVQRVIEHNSGVEIPWDDVNNGRSAADFLQENFSVIATAFAAAGRREAEALMFHKVKQDVQSEMDDLCATIHQQKKQLAEVHRELATTKRQLESQVRTLSSDLERKVAAVSRAENALAILQSESSSWQNQIGVLTAKLSAEREKSVAAEERLQTLDIDRCAAQRELRDRVSVAQKTAEAIARKVAAESEKEIARLTNEVVSLHRQRDIMNSEMALYKDTSQQRMAALEAMVTEFRKTGVPRRVFDSVLAEYAGTLGGFILQHAKQLRLSVVKDTTSLLRTTCVDTCLQLSKALQRAVVWQRSDNAAAAVTAGDALELVKRVESQSGWEVDECVKLKESPQLLDPSEAIIANFRKEALKTKDELRQKDDIIQRLQTEVTKSAAAKDNQMVAASVLVKHLHSTLVELCDSCSTPSAATALPFATWSAVPSTLPSDVLQSICTVAAWPGMVQMATELMHTVRHALTECLRRPTAAAALASSLPRSPIDAALLSITADNSHHRADSAAARGTQPLNVGDAPQQALVSVLSSPITSGVYEQRATPGLKGGGAFQHQFAKRFQMLERAVASPAASLLSVSVTVLPSAVEDSSASVHSTDALRVLLEVRCHLHAQVQAFVEPMCRQLLRTSTTHSNNAAGVESHTVVSPLASPPTPSLGEFAFSIKQQQSLPAAVRKLRNALLRYKETIQATSWGACLVALTKRRCRLKINRLQNSVTLLSRQCEQRCLGEKLRRAPESATLSGGVVDTLQVFSNLREQIIARCERKMTSLNILVQAELSHAEAVLRTQLQHCFNAAQVVAQWSKYLRQEEEAPTFSSEFPRSQTTPLPPSGGLFSLEASVNSGGSPGERNHDDEAVQLREEIQQLKNIVEEMQIHGCSPRAALDESTTESKPLNRTPRRLSAGHGKSSHARRQSSVSPGVSPRVSPAGSTTLTAVRFAHALDSDRDRRESAPFEIPRLNVDSSSLNHEQLQPQMATGPPPLVEATSVASGLIAETASSRSSNATEALGKTRVQVQKLLDVIHLVSSTTEMHRSLNTDSTSQISEAELDSLPAEVLAARVADAWRTREALSSTSSATLKPLQLFSLPTSNAVQPLPDALEATAKPCDVPTSSTHMEIACEGATQTQDESVSAEIPATERPMTADACTASFAPDAAESIDAVMRVDAICETDPQRVSATTRCDAETQIAVSYADRSAQWTPPQETNKVIAQPLLSSPPPTTSALAQTKFARSRRLMSAVENLDKGVDSLCVKGSSSMSHLVANGCGKDDAKNSCDLITHAVACQTSMELLVTFAESLYRGSTTTAARQHDCNSTSSIVKELQSVVQPSVAITSAARTVVGKVGSVVNSTRQPCSEVSIRPWSATSNPSTTGVPSATPVRSTFAAVAVRPTSATLFRRK